MYELISRAVARRRCLRLDAITLFLDYSGEELSDMLFSMPPGCDTPELKNYLAGAIGRALKLRCEFDATKGAADRYYFKNQLEVRRRKLRARGAISRLRVDRVLPNLASWDAEFG